MTAEWNTCACHNGQSGTACLRDSRRPTRVRSSMRSWPMTSSELNRSAQWAAAAVESSCDCGCGSIGFMFSADARDSLRPPPAKSPLPVEAEVINVEGEAIGGVLVLLRDGWLDDVDVYSYESRSRSRPLS